MPQHFKNILKTVFEEQHNVHVNIQPLVLLSSVNNDLLLAPG